MKQEKMLPIHPMASAFLLIEGQDFDDLVASIKKNGLREKITTHEGQVLDGTNRQRACSAAKHKPLYKEWEPPDPEATGESLQEALYDFVKDKNLNRRHSTQSDKGLSAAKLRACVPGLTIEKAAADFDVSPRTVASASKIVQDGVPEVILAVEKHTIPVHVGAAISQLPAKEQPQAVEKAVSDAKVLKKRKPRSKKEKPEPIFDDGVDIAPPVATPVSSVSEAVTHTLPEHEESSGPVTIKHDHFTAVQQKAWKQSFQNIVRMADEWQYMPAQKKMKVSAQKLHTKALAVLTEYHQLWETMNPGGQWS